MPRRPLVDVAEVARYLGDTETHVRYMVQRRTIPHTHVGRKLRFDLDKIDRWLEDNEAEAAS